MQDKRKRIQNLCCAIMLLLVAITGLLILASEQWVQTDWFVILSFCINILVFIFQLMLSLWARPFGLDFLFWLFNLFFFGFAPLLQYATNVYAWDLKPETHQIWQTNLLVLLWSFAYMVGRLFADHYHRKGWHASKVSLTKRFGLIINSYLIKFAIWLEQCSVWKRINGSIAKIGPSLERKIQDCHNKKENDFGEKILTGVSILYQKLLARDRLTKVMDCMLVVSVLITIFHIGKIGFWNLFSRATANLAVGGQTATLLFTHIMKNTVLFVAAFHVVRAVAKKRLNGRTVVALLCLLISCFPTALPRNMMASFYAGLLILLIPQTRKGRWYALLIVGGLILLFPAVEIFRNMYSMENVDVGALLAHSFNTTYLGGHYDAHQNTVSAFNYVSEFGITWGRQMLGALLYFVPRALWPGKPIGTGAMLMQELNQFYFSNVSASLMLEGYINFGIIGVFLFGIIVGFAACTVDRAYWKEKRRWALIRVIYPFTIFQFFFMLRGDMMSSWAYLSAQVVVGIFWWTVLTVFGKKHPTEVANKP